MATTGHESEAINVAGLKASLQKLKTDHIDGKADEATTLAGYGITDAYTKTEVNGLVDTPHQNYVTVAATSQTTAATDVLPASGQAADTIYRVSNWDGSANSGAGAFDATCYSEYAWDDVSNPNKYVFLCVKSQIGEVFDITAYNSNTKYADLAAALNGGANIPQSLQKGGMSVKYVCSSDNKYVQFRLMSDNFETSVDNWQGVDSEVTNLSNNLVTSGAAALQINTLLRRTFSEVVNSSATIIASTSNEQTLYRGIIQAGTKVRLTIVSDTSFDLICITEKAQYANQIFYFAGITANVPAVVDVTTAIDVKQMQLWTSSSIANSGTISIKIEIGTDCLSKTVTNNTSSIDNNKSSIDNIASVLPTKKDIFFSAFDTHESGSSTQTDFTGWATRFSPVPSAAISFVDINAIFYHETAAEIPVIVNICDDSLNVISTKTIQVQTSTQYQSLTVAFDEPVNIDGNFYIMVYTENGYIYAGARVSTYCTAEAGHTNKYRTRGGNWENLNNNPKSYSIDVVLYNKSLKALYNETIINVGDYSGADFAEIQDAINDIWEKSKNNPYIIYVHQKNEPYKAFSMIRKSFTVQYPWSGSITKNISIIGLDKEHCVIESDKGDYYNPACELLTNGVIKNMHFKLTNSNHLASSTEGGYAAHIDSRTADDVGYNMTIEDCIFESETGPAVGIGLHSNVNLKFNRCQFVSSADPSYNPVEGYQNLANWGCVFLHTSTRADAVNQLASFVDCIGENITGQSSLWTSYEASANGVITLIRNVFWERTRGIPGYRLSESLNYNPMNFGNNTPT